VTLGFVVGKFYPPHRGHKHLIDSARRQCDRLVVLLPHHPSQKIPGELRKAWLEEIHPDCEIHLVPDKLENDSAQWAKFTIDHLGRSPDVVFSSEDYGPEFAHHLRCRHVMVDRDRRAVPTSGTKIRADPLGHLDDLEPCVRAHFVRRIVLIGAESTGKTTLARQLAERFNTTWVREFGREYWEKKVAGLSMDGPLPGWTSEEFLTIAAEQQRRENLAARSANRLLVCDTNAFATGTWHERYMGSRDKRVDMIGRADKADLYLLTEPDFPFVQDGFRDGESIRNRMHERFTQLLSEQPTPVVRINGVGAVRLERSVMAIEPILCKPLAL
jgi:HTH-type transcriptional regulator, transcriptional repressor of NAD biosynthesis genes